MHPERSGRASPFAASPSPAAPPGLRPSETFVPELDALRGWAILLVFVYHADFAIHGMARQGTTVSPFVAFMTAGHTGVTLFFVLSAYLLWRPFLRAARGGARVRTADFFRRRALRILPLYTAAVGLAVALRRDEPNAVLEGLASLTFWTSLTGTPESLLPYSAVWWSLATEAQFYALLPVLGWGLVSRTGRGVVLALAALWIAAYATVAWRPEALSLDARLQAGLSLIGRAPAFLAGMAAAWGVEHHGERLRQWLAKPGWLARGGADLVLGAALLLLGALLGEVTRRGFYVSEIELVGWHWAEGAIWGGVLLWLLLAPLRLRPWIAHPWLARVGVLSYSIYLVHYPILEVLVEGGRGAGIDLIDDLPARAFVIALALLLCVLVSSLTYTGIERPFLLRKARIPG